MQIFVTAIAPELLKGFEPKLTQHTSHTGVANGLGIEGYRCKGQGRRNIYGISVAGKDHLVVKLFLAMSVEQPVMYLCCTAVVSVQCKRLAVQVVL